MFGVALGAGLAYALVQWRKAAMPSIQLRSEPEDLSIYAVSGEAPNDEATHDEGMYDESTQDWTAALWGDVPATVPSAAPLMGATAGPLMGATAAPLMDATAESDGDIRSERPRRNALEEIEGIGPSYAKILAGLGLLTADDLLFAGADPKGREGLVGATGISGKLILRWVNQADLFRVKGVGEQYADLLEAAGVDTVPELAQRRADNLGRKLAEVNELKNLVRRIPTEGQVAAWIESARTLPRVVTY
jgi:predicted flap endonuclease-1-like 5' DNA nuclease